MAENLEAEQKANDCYTKESWKRVQIALDEARELMADEKASQKDVDEAFLELITACNLLENTVQKVALEAAVAGAKEILADEEGLKQYTEESVENLRNVLAEAEKVLAEEAADQETVNAASRSLMDAVTSLVVAEQDTRLDILIQKAEELLYNNLAEAMTFLVRKADKSELKTALDKANEILENSGKYVESTIIELALATDEAQSVYDDEDADVTAVGEAVKSLVNEILKARLLGDVDGNGIVDSADSAKVLKYVAEKQELDEIQHKAADVNHDSVSDSNDVAFILQYVSEKIAGF